MEPEVDLTTRDWQYTTPTPEKEPELVWRFSPTSKTNAPSRLPAQTPNLESGRTRAVTKPTPQHAYRHRNPRLPTTRRRPRPEQRHPDPAGPRALHPNRSTLGFADARGSSRPPPVGRGRRSGPFAARLARGASAGCSWWEGTSPPGLRLGSRREGVRLGGREVGRGQRLGDGVRVEHQVGFSMNPGVGVVRRGVQSRPKPRGSSTSRASRSTSQTPSRSSAVLESARDSGRPSRQAWYSSCRVRSSARAATHRFGRAAFARAGRSLDREPSAARRRSPRESGVEAGRALPTGRVAGVLLCRG